MLRADLLNGREYNDKYTGESTERRIRSASGPPEAGFGSPKGGFVGLSNILDSE